ncbi:MAG: hypothetical protein ACLFQY_21295 [Desulfococcaceae bacterium]
MLHATVERILKNPGGTSVIFDMRLRCRECNWTGKAGDLLLEPTETISLPDYDVNCGVGVCPRCGAKNYAKETAEIIPFPKNGKRSESN